MWLHYTDHVVIFKNQVWKNGPFFLSPPFAGIRGSISLHCAAPLGNKPQVHFQNADFSTSPSVLLPLLHGRIRFNLLDWPRKIMRSFQNFLICKTLEGNPRACFLLATGYSIQQLSPVVKSTTAHPVQPGFQLSHRGRPGIISREMPHVASSSGNWLNDPIPKSASNCANISGNAVSVTVKEMDLLKI